MAGILRCCGLWTCLNGRIGSGWGRPFALNAVLVGEADHLGADLLISHGPLIPQMQILNALLRGQALLIGVFLRIWGGLVGDSGLIVIVGGAFLFANGLRIARAMVTTLNARGVWASCRSVDRTRVHTSINKQRLLKSNQWELFLKSFCDAFDFDAANILTRRITIILRCSKLLKRCKMRLLVTLMDILFHVCLWLKLLLFEVLLGTIKLMVLIIRQKHVLITGLAACSACLE